MQSQNLPPSVKVSQNLLNVPTLIKYFFLLNSSFKNTFSYSANPVIMLEATRDQPLTPSRLYLSHYILIQPLFCPASERGKPHLPGSTSNLTVVIYFAPVRQNRVEPDLPPHVMALARGLHSWQILLLSDTRHKWVALESR